MYVELEKYPTKPRQSPDKWSRKPDKAPRNGTNEQKNMEKNRIITGTNGNYSIKESGEVFNAKTGREIRPYRPGSVKIIRHGKRTTLNITETVAEMFSPGYVDDAPKLMQNIKDQLIAIQSQVAKLLKDIDRGEKMS